MRGLRRSWNDFRRHPWVHGLSVTTIGLSLFLLGACLMGYRNFQSLADQAQEKRVGTVFLDEGIAETEAEKLREELLATEGVVEAQYRKRGDVTAEIGRFLGARHDEALPGADLFPDLIELKFDQIAGPKAIRLLGERLRDRPEVAEVDFGAVLGDRLDGIRKWLRIVGWIFTGALLLGCAVVMANFTGLRQQARSREIEIVQMIGASRWYVLSPFVWESVLEGLAGSGLALSLLALAMAGLTSTGAVEWLAALGLDEVRFLSVAQLLLVVAVGVGTALVGNLSVFLRLRKEAV